MFSGRNTQLKYLNSIVTDVQQLQLNVDMMMDTDAAITLLEKRLEKIFRLSPFFRFYFPVVLWLHSHPSSCLHLIATVGHLLLLQYQTHLIIIGGQSNLINTFQL